VTTKTELVTRLSTAASITKDKAREIIDLIADFTFEDLANSNVAVLPGLGKLKVRERGERQGRNPKTGDTMVIPARSVVKFTAGRGLKSFVATGFEPASIDIHAGEQ
jgi:nucleoid DNA-binding protein